VSINCCFAVEDVEGGEQRRRAMTLVVVGAGGRAAGLHWQAGLGAVERPGSSPGQALDRALLVYRQHDGVRLRIVKGGDKTIQ
jgi:hypothetical protein